MNKEQIKTKVIELITKAIKHESVWLDRIVEKAPEEELNEPGAICDLYTVLMEDAARQLATNPRQYSRRVHKESRARVRRFWWLAQG